MSALLHTARLVVRWGDMDALGHVNNAAYFTYFEQARVEALAALGVALGADAAFVIASTSIVYRRPVTYPAAVLVRVSAGPPGRTSFPTTYALTVEGDDAVYASGEATIVQVDAATGRAVRLDEGVRRALEARLSGPAAPR